MNLKKELQQPVRPGFYIDTFDNIAIRLPNGCWERWSITLNNWIYTGDKKFDLYANIMWTFLDHI